MTFQTVDEVDLDPLQCRIYAEGWQSWSPTTWYSPLHAQHRPDETWQHTMRFRPGVSLPSDVIQGEGLLVVDPGGGEPARLYAVAEATERVATIRALRQRDRLVISSDADVEVKVDTGGPLAALASFGDEFAARAGVGQLQTAPRVWCSWYRYFENITAPDIEENLSTLDEYDIHVDVVQIDDGWSRGLGEWMRPTDGFRSLRELIDTIRETGRQAGIWLAPFLVGSDSDLARRHPDWLIGDAGHNWGQQLAGLDLTHPGVREYLFRTLRGLRDMGIGYVKLDFLYGGALLGRRHDDVAAVAAYRSGLALIREAVGDETYILGCGAPILPSVGLVDAMRVSPDTFHEGGEDGSEGLRGRMSLVSRAWQQGRFWVNDPDCLVARPSFDQRVPWSETVERYGGLRSCSDRFAELDEWGLQTTRRLFANAPGPEPFSADVVALGAEPADCQLPKASE